MTRRIYSTIAASMLLMAATVAAQTDAPTEPDAPTESDASPTPAASSPPNEAHES